MCPRRRSSRGTHRGAARFPGGTALRRCGDYLSTDGLPHQTVVWYALDGDAELVLSTPSGSLKHRHLLRDPRLSVCVEDGFRYVTVSGRVRIEEEP
jgi:hypothetical protein